MGCEVSISIVHPDNDTTVTDTSVDVGEKDENVIEKVSIAKPLKRMDSVESFVSIDSR